MNTQKFSSTEQKIELYKIKYDMKDIQLYKKLTFIGIALALLPGIVCIYAFTRTPSDTSIFSDTVSVFCMLAFPVLLCMVIGFLTIFFDAKGYMKRLTKYGYVPPENKKDISNGLLGLSKTPISTPICRTNTDSLVLSILSGILLICITVYTFVWARTPHFITIGIFAINAIYYIIQIPDKWFRDDVDITGNMKRRIRKNLPVGVVKILFGAFILFLIGIYSMDHLPTSKGSYYNQIMRYNKRNKPAAYALYPEELPEHVENLHFFSANQTCYVSFYAPENDMNEMLAYFNTLEALEACYIYGEDEVFESHYYEATNNIPVFETANPNACMIYQYDAGFWMIVNEAEGVMGFGRCQ